MTTNIEEIGMDEDESNTQPFLNPRISMEDLLIGLFVCQLVHLYVLTMKLFF